MANSKQAAKRAKQADKSRGANMGLRSTLRSAIKKVRTAIAGGDAKAAQDALREQQSTIDAIADKRIIHKNKAARHKSRLAQQVKAHRHGRAGEIHRAAAAPRHPGGRSRALFCMDKRCMISGFVCALSHSQP